MSSPDYMTLDKDHAVQDFKERIAVYEDQYCTLDEEHDKNLSFIKIFNQGERYLINNIHGMQAAVCLSSCVFYYLVTFVVENHSHVIVCDCNSITAN